MEFAQREIIVKGKVQGVYYRKSAQIQANFLHVNGKIKNLENGDVLIRVEGDLPHLELFIQWCWQGPPGAKVSSVLVQEIHWPEKFSDFEISK